MNNSKINFCYKLSLQHKWSETGNTNVQTIDVYNVTKNNDLMCHTNT